MSRPGTVGPRTCGTVVRARTPCRYCWRMRTRWAATANAGDQLFIFLIYSDNPTDATQTDCGYAFVDQTYTSLTGIVSRPWGSDFSVLRVEPARVGQWVL